MVVLVLRFNNGEVVKFVSNTANAEYYIYINGSNVATVITDNSGFVEYDTGNWNSGISSIGFAISPGKGATVLFAVYIDDAIVIDNQDITLSGNTDLVFANGTDMSAVAAGDVVQQELNQFVEPLESTSSSGLAYEDGLTYSTAGSTSTVIESGTPDRMFDGSIDGYRAYGYYISSGGQTCVFRVNIPEGTAWAEGPCYIGVQAQSNSRYAASNTRPTVSSSLGSPTKVNEVFPSSGNYYIEVPDGQRLAWFQVTTGATPGINASFATIAGWWKFDSVPVAGDFTAENALLDIPTKTELVFAGGTDMSALEAGDEVTQPSEIAGRTWSDELTEQGGSGPNDPQNVFDGNTFSSCQSFNYNGTIIGPSPDYTLTGKLKITWALANGTYAVLYKDKNNTNTSVNFTGSNGFGELDVEELTYIQIKYQDFQNYTKMNSISVRR